MTHRNIFLFTALLFLSYWACKDNEQSLVETPRSPGKPLAFVFEHDVSKTFKYGVVPDAGLLRSAAQQVANSGGIIAFGLIGTPDSTGALVRKEFVRPPLPKTAPTYLDKILYQQAMDSANRINRQLIESFATESLELLEKHKNHEHSDVNMGLVKANTFFHEPGMEIYEPLIFLNTDGLQDVRMHPFKVDTTLNTSLLSSDVHVITSGWKHPEQPTDWKKIESPQGLEKSLIFFTSQ